jgi:uncharacterized membrane protein YqjE
MSLFGNFIKPIKRFHLEIKTAENNDQSTTRWGVVHLLFAIAFFFFGLSLASLSIIFDVWDKNMGLAIFLTIFLVIAFIIGCLFAYKAVSLASKWLSEGSKDPTATKQDLKQLKDDILEIVNNVTRQQAEQSENHARKKNTKPKR